MGLELAEFGGGCLQLQTAGAPLAHDETGDGYRGKKTRSQQVAHKMRFAYPEERLHQFSKTTT